MTATGDSDTGTLMMDTGAPQSTRRKTYVGVALVLVVLLVLSLVLFRPARASAAADERADQLIAALDEAGVQAPAKEQIVRVLGEDGGAVCADPTSALKRALLYGELTNGAAGPGMRPVITDRRAVRGEALIISIYCPDELPEFTELVESMAFANVINDR